MADPARHHVDRNCGLRDIDAQFGQLTVDLGSAPTLASKIILRIRSRTSLPIRGQPPRRREDPIRAHVWAPILGRDMPSFLTQFDYVVEWSKKFVQEAPETNMFDGTKTKRKSTTAIKIVENHEARHEG